MCSSGEFFTNGQSRCGSWSWLWTWRSLGNPIARQSQELLIRNRRHGSRLAMLVATWRPRPLHQRRPEMGEELIWLHSASCRVEQRTAELTNRESFPRHPQWCELPIRDSRYPRCSLVGRPVTRGAVQSSGAFVGGAARYVHVVAAAIITLAWEIGTCVAVHAARMLKNCCHPTESLLPIQSSILPE